MDIAALSINQSQAAVQQQAATAVLDMNMEAMEESGANLIKMMELSVNPHLGSNFDVSV